MPVLWLPEYNSQGSQAHKHTRYSKDKILYKLQTQVYTQKSKACRAAEQGGTRRASRGTINGTMNIITFAFDMSAAVKKFVTKAKRFYYLVMLFGCRCPKCNGSLTMADEGRCRCSSCSYEFDPTVEFQRCSNCGGIPVLRMRRYHCRKCGRDVTSTFLFDGIVFDAKYFCRKMAESRHRKKKQRERVRKILAECRSGPLAIEATDLDSIPGLVEVLNSLTGVL